MCSKVVKKNKIKLGALKIMAIATIWMGGSQNTSQNYVYCESFYAGQ